MPESAQRLVLEVALEDGDPDAVDWLTRQLLAEMLELPIESAELASGPPAPPGGKAADPVTIGAIALAVLPGAIQKLAAFLQAWVDRGPGRTIRFKGEIDGRMIEFEGAPSDLERVLSRLEQGKAPAGGSGAAS